MPDQLPIIRWEEPARALGGGGGRPHSQYQDIARQLAARPGDWAVVQERHSRIGSGLASHIRKGHIDCFTPPGDFDACTRQVNGVATVYARYVGGGDA